MGEIKLELWVRFRFMYARRRAAPDQPAPPLPSLSPACKTESVEQEEILPISRKYPYITYFKTAEDAARNVEARQAAVPPYPESDCERAWFLKQMQEQPGGNTSQTAG